MGETGRYGWDREIWVGQGDVGETARGRWVRQGEVGGTGRYGWDREMLVEQGEAKRQSAKVKTKWANLALAAWIGFKNTILTL